MRPCSTVFLVGGAFFRQQPMAPPTADGATNSQCPGQQPLPPTIAASDLSAVSKKTGMPVGTPVFFPILKPTSAASPSVASTPSAPHSPPAPSQTRCTASLGA